MKKGQLVERALQIQPQGVDLDAERKRLSKLKKPQVLEAICRLQFAKWGRYDVCCVDEHCECFRNGIECQVDSDCCDCGGDVVYNNYIGDAWTLQKARCSKR